MNPDVSLLVKDIFEKAAQPGPVREPAAVAAALAKLASECETPSIDMTTLQDALDAEFPWRNQLVFQSRQTGPDEREVWAQAVRWLINAIVATRTDSDLEATRFQVMLAALGILDVGGEGVGSVIDRFAGTHVLASVASLVARLGFLPSELDENSKATLKDLTEQFRAGDFKSLQHSLPAMQLNFGPDIWSAVFLLWKLDAALLARLLDQRGDFTFAMMVCSILGPQSPLFALQVRSVTFKFLSIPWLERLTNVNSGVTAGGVLKDLLLQVAKTSHWKGWLNATYEYPEASSAQARAALAEALVQLDEPQWRDLIEAVALSTSRGSPEGLADILNQVAGQLGDSKTQPFWDAAFARWDAWDYGKSHAQFLSSPNACSFDFPVAMYYARLPAQQRLAEEVRLQQEIASIEQRWFANESQLCSERNRFASRLRLVRHGTVLAAGGNHALPGPVRVDSEYAEVRYRYHNVDDAITRTVAR